MYCERCNSEHSGEYGSGRFCSRACANTRVFTTETIIKKKKSAKNSNAVKLANELQKKLKINKVCPMCFVNFQVHASKEDKIYCSRKCMLNDTEFKYRKKTPGGVREGSGRSKSGYYKGIFCSSTYELVYLIWCLDNSISINRCGFSIPYTHDGEQHLYFPDFISNGTILEIKGYHTDAVDAKQKAALDNGYKYQILYKLDLAAQFEYVSTTYGTRDYASLYDTSKHVNTYRCCNCLCEYKSSKEKPTINYCSRKCSGAGTRKLKKSD